MPHINRQVILQKKNSRKMAAPEQKDAGQSRKVDGAGPSNPSSELPEWLKLNKNGTHSVFEGSAEIIFENDVFYNPVQQFNRDMSVAAIGVWRDMRFLEQATRDKRKLAAREGQPSLVENEGVSGKDVTAKAVVEGTDADVSAADKSTEKEKNDQPEQEKDGNQDEKTKDDLNESAANEADMSSSEKRRLERQRMQLQALRQAASAVEFEPVDLTHADHSNRRFTILEALSATGLRSVRYAKEISHVGEIVANDLAAKAVDAIRRNVQHNSVDAIVVPKKGDACQAMYEALGSGKRFDVVDLDPYGSAAPFLDAAVQVVADGGLLCVTCTDLAVLAGSQPESCWAKYGGINIPGAPYTHELALRILLHSIQSTAAKYRRAIEPILSCSIDFYVRVFVRVRESASLAKEAASKTSLVYHCTGCKSFVLQPLGKKTQRERGVHYGLAVGPTSGQQCEHCSNPSHVGGPFYSGSLHSPEFVARMLDHVATAGPERYGTHTRMAGMLTVQSEELQVPFYYTVPTLSNALNCQNPPLVDLSSAILNAGYKISSTHAAPASIKTDAPASVVWDIMRCWCKRHPPSDKNMSANSPARRLLQQTPTIQANFEKHPGATPTSRKFSLVRYQVNPTPNWGPKARPKRAKQNDTDEQGKTKANKRIKKDPTNTNQ